jgi:2-dehydro-3-deoxygalactonokinase
MGDGMAYANPAWVAVDWGTTNLRLWVIGETGDVLDMRRSDRGMSRLKSDQYEETLTSLISDILIDGQTIPVVCCGMVGAKSGWVEAPYLSVPCAPSGPAHIVPVTTKDQRISTYILPGLSQSNPADVMRGEETQIQGYIANHPHWDGVICLPGTHSKWVHVSAGEVISFQTFMTGELFEHLSQHSILRLSVGSEGCDQDAFENAVTDVMSSPQSFAARLFALRANDLVNGQNPVTARSQLSGYLMGLELAGARAYWLGQDIVLVGDTSLCTLYQSALDMMGAPARRLDATELTLNGLRSAYNYIIGNPS